MRKPYSLEYPDGSKRNIGRVERDRLLAAKQARESGPCAYIFIRPVQVFHSLADLKQYSTFVRPDTRHFLDGQALIWVLGIHRTRELMETPEGMVARLAEVEILEAT